MDSEFTEFSYEFALTSELTQPGVPPGQWAPYFPSLIEEGKSGGGYDVRIIEPLIVAFNEPQSVHLTFTWHTDC
jgi:hypothetical protein